MDPTSEISIDCIHRTDLKIIMVDGMVQKGANGDTVYDNGQMCTAMSVKRHGVLTGNILVHSDDASSICWGGYNRSLWRKLGEVVDRK